MKQYNAGVIGATGMVGQRFLLLLENHPFSRLRLWQRPVVLPEKLTEKQSRTNGRSIVPFPKNMFP